MRPATISNITEPVRAISVTEAEDMAGYLRNLATTLYWAGTAKDAPEWMHAHLEGLHAIARDLDGFDPEWNLPPTCSCVFCRENPRAAEGR